MSGQKWSFAGVELNTKGWSVIEVPEGIGTVGFRGGNIQIPFQDGKRWMKKRYEERVVMLPMWVRGLDTVTGKLLSGTSPDEKLYENIDFLSRLFGKKGEHTLRRTLPDGSEREAMAEVYKQVNFVKSMPGYAKFAVEFLLSDPFFYAISKTQETKAISSDSYEWSHSNEGTAPITDVTITLSGPMESPKLECLGSNVWLQFQGSIGSGESVLINAGDFTCNKGSSNMISAIKHGGDAQWFILESGYNQLRISGASGGSVKLEYYPAYF